MSELIERVERSIVSRHLVKPREKLLVAVSGGIDSAVLLHLLNRLSSRHGWRLVVAHFNHQLRGKNSDSDERWVRRSAKRLQLTAVTDRGDVKGFAGREKISVEMAARQLRHEFLARTACELGAGSVALAHHADDQVELFFLRLFRGAGGEGLAGMKWSGPSPVDSKVQLVRPLLDISRAELERFVHEEKIAFREDASNAQLNCERNRIRHKLLPNLRQSISRKVDKPILRSMEIIGAESDFAGESARAWLERKTAGEFGRLHLAVQRRVLHTQLLARGTVPDFESIERLRAASYTRITVAPSLTLWRDAEGLIHAQRRTESKDFNTGGISFALSGKSGHASFDGCTVVWRMRRDSNERTIALLPSPGCEYFDAGQVGGAVTVRHWRPGDRFQPIGMAKPVKLQDWFVNQKVPRSRRHDLLLAGTQSGQIFWVEGLRIGDGFKLKKKTDAVLEWRWSRG